MDQSLVKLVQSLSKSDKKSLSQKLTKTVEEVGELAKEINPYESAFATTHRFSSKSKILEEVADSLLCLYSIAFDIGYSISDIEDMMATKAGKWAGLQQKEGTAKWPIPFEIHVTVRGDDPERFRNACLSLGVKPLFIEGERERSVVLHDLQTSSVFLGTNTTVYAEMNRIVKGLQDLNFDPIRRKIEAAPWHPGTPQDYNDPFISNSYFEAHLSVTLHSSEVSRLHKVLDKVSSNIGISRNVFKWLEDGYVRLLLTKKSRVVHRDRFREIVDSFKKDLENEEFVVDKPIIEFVVYDSNETHDEEWLRIEEGTK